MDLAVALSSKTLLHFLLSGSFVLYSEHQALRTALKKADIQRRLTRCLSLTDEYKFEICHLLGNKNFIAGYLSRSADLSSEI